MKINKKLTFESASVFSRKTFQDIPQEAAESTGDYLMRIEQSGNQFKIQGWPTEAVQAVVQEQSTSLLEIKEILIEALQGCKRYLDYMGHYIAFLLGQISEEDFENMSKQYVQHQPIIPHNRLDRKIEILFRETGVEFSPIELAAIFSAPKDQIDQTLDALITKGKLTLITNGT